MNNKKMSLTVGIPTYYGGPALISAIKSILASKGVGKLRIIVNIDGNPLQPEIEKELKNLGVDVVFSAIRGGQVTRIKQMISLTKSHLLVLTQDDIQFEPDALPKIIKAFQINPHLTMIGARVLSAPAKTFFEKVVEVGVRLTLRTGGLWNNGDNYLMASGRCLGFRASFIKKFQIPDEVINSDAYLYFENKRLNGIFRHLHSAVVYNKSPQKLKEHLKQSRKFQFSKEELEKYLNIDLDKEYKIPASIKIRAILDELLANFLNTTLYLLIFTYTRIRGKNMYSKATRFWSTDLSTKKI